MSQIANKNVVNQDTIKSRVQLDKFNLALKQKDKISGLNAQTDSNRIQAEPSHTCELLVTATEDDAHTPRYDTNPKAAQQARKYDRPTLEPVHLRNTNECDSVGTPPHMETLQSNNKDKFAMGGEPGKLKIDDLKVLPS